MMSDWRKQTDSLVLEGGIHMPYSWTVGRTGSKFFLALRDDGRIMASRCTQCEFVWVPPRLRCPVCFKQIEDADWLEVGPEGTVRHFTIVHYEHSAQPLKPPFAYALIDLDGADVAITHLIYGIDPSGLRSGLRVKPVMENQRQGYILDIAYFKPLRG
jgi:uncharacterized OB-fold protein